MYPVIKFPYYILTAKNKNLPTPLYPSLPIEPLRKKNIMPYVGGLLFVLFAFVVPFFGIIGVILLIYGLTQENNKNKNTYNIRLKNFEKEKMLYVEALSNYKSQLNGYEKSNILNKVEFVEKYRNNIDFEIDTENSKKGKTEKLFEEKLINEFGDKILVNKKVNELYYPDFIYKDEKIIIDIEIDEPYDYLTKEPIHYLGADDYRNSFFSSKGFYVVRFAEVQIFKNPNSCVQYIKSLVQKFRNNPLCEELPEFNNYCI